MSEQGMRQRIIRALKPFDAVSVENSAYPGTPDVNYVEGWLELKWVRDWPVRGGPLIIDHFTPQQRVWLVRRWKAGGNVFLLLQVEQRWWAIFDGEAAAQYVGKVPREELENVAMKVWKNGLVDQELREFLHARNI